MNKRLGRGLDALIPSLNINDDEKVIEIPLKQLRVNPYQPRKSFNEETIRELASSIQEHGVIQPIIVRSVLRGYEIIAGERRYRASLIAERETIPAVVKNFSDRQVMEIALIENIQREDLNAIELALAYQSLADEFQMTQEELSLKVGKSRSHVANFLRLLQLPEEIKQNVSRGTLSMGHARALAGVKNDKLKKQLAETTVREQWSVRELEEAIKKSEERPAKENAQKKLSANRNPFINAAEENLRNQFQTTVKIKHQNHKGKIEIAYYSDDDLQRLLDMLHR